MLFLLPMAVLALPSELTPRDYADIKTMGAIAAGVGVSTLVLQKPIYALTKQPLTPAIISFVGVSAIAYGIQMKLERNEEQNALKLHPLKRK